MFGRKKRKVENLVKGYDEGRRLMRQGDGADEWIGMSLTRESLLGLVAIGRDQAGEKRTPDELEDVLHKHRLSWDDLL